MTDSEYKMHCTLLAQVGIAVALFMENTYQSEKHTELDQQKNYVRSSDFVACESCGSRTVSIKIPSLEVLLTCCPQQCLPQQKRCWYGHCNSHLLKVVVIKSRGCISGKQHDIKKTYIPSHLFHFKFNREPCKENPFLRLINFKGFSKAAHYSSFLWKSWTIHKILLLIIFKSEFWIVSC